jgi:hypothetical protein
MRQSHKSCISILIGVDRNGADAGIFRSPDDADCNFSPIGNEQLCYTSHAPSLDVFRLSSTRGPLELFTPTGMGDLLQMVRVQGTLVGEG